MSIIFRKYIILFFQLTNGIIFLIYRGIDKLLFERQFKTFFTFQIRKEDKNEVEQNIRDALESVCNPDDVEKELRSALATLNLESREEYS